MELLAPYKRILVALDGSRCSDIAMEAALALADKNEAHLIGCHVYAAEMHRVRFGQMEPVLPEQFREKGQLDGLRQAHGHLINHGMKLVSEAYLDPLARKARAMGISYEGVTPEGRNYVELLKVSRERDVDLVVLGALGQGRVPEESLGSLTERILLLDRTSDLLVMRRPWDFKGRPIVAGVDGSENSYAAVLRAAEIGLGFGTRIEVLAVYDPYFHTEIFRSIAGSLIGEASFDLSAQEKLHDEIIDQGLERLYRAGMEQVLMLARSMGAEVGFEVVTGKVYSQIHHYASLRGANLVVVGRWGLHREKESSFGSNALNLARLSNANVLVVRPPKEPI